MDHPENDAQYAGLAVNKGIEQPPIVNPYLKKDADSETSILYSL